MTYKDEIENGCALKQTRQILEQIHGLDKIAMV
jgi:hypothetical protein